LEPVAADVSIYNAFQNAGSLGPDLEDRHTVTLTANDRCIKSNFANEHQLISLS